MIVFDDFGPELSENQLSVLVDWVQCGIFMCSGQARPPPPTLPRRPPSVLRHSTAHTKHTHSTRTAGRCMAHVCAFLMSAKQHRCADTWNLQRPPAPTHRRPQLLCVPPFDSF